MTVVSWAYWLVSLWFVRRTFSSGRCGRAGTSKAQEGADRATAGCEGPPAYTPPVSVLKPVKGLDHEAYVNFASFCRQNYPVYEVLFAVAEPDDPSLPVIRQIQADFPDAAVRVVTSPPEGLNRKAGMLAALAGRARYDVLVAADSDMRATPDYLRRVVAPLADPGVGMVTCLYRGTHRETFTARLEALYIGASFVPYVAVGRAVLRMRFALGATMALRREALEAVGGFRAVDPFLADDYQLGRRVGLSGRRVHLSDYLVEYVLGPTTFREQWHREVRWARCIRVSRRLEYPLLLVSFATPLSVLAALVAGPRRPLSWMPAGTSVALRAAVAWWVTAYSGDREIRRWLPLLPLRDGLSALVWLAAGVSRRVVWRGERYYVSPDGRLSLADPSLRRRAVRELPARMGRRIVFALEKALRRWEGIFEFSRSDEVLMRVARARAEENVRLADGTRVAAGELVGELHLWNEHIPRLPPGGPDLRWAVGFRRDMRATLEALAQAAEEDERLSDLPAFFGVTLWPAQYGPQFAELLERWGFELVPEVTAPGAVTRLVRVGDGLYRVALTWAFNPNHQRAAAALDTSRPKIWLSRRSLLEHYGGDGAGSASSASPTSSTGTP